MSTGASASPTAAARRARLLVSPAVLFLMLGSVIPLLITIMFSLERYNLLDPETTGFTGLDNYRSLLSDASFWSSLRITLALTGSTLIVTVVGGILLAVLLDESFPGRGIARLMAIAPFFVMPTVSALIWKNLIMHPVYGVLAKVAQLLGMTPIDWFADYPLTSLIIILSWEWVPFALLILLTALQSLDQEQREAAKMDGAGSVAQFFYITLPHLRRAIAIVVMMETIFLLSVFAEIFVTTSGGPGTATTNLTFLIYGRALLQFDIGGASAAGVAAIILANLIAAVLARFAMKRLEI